MLRHVPAALASLERLLEHAASDTCCAGKETSLDCHLCLTFIPTDRSRHSEEGLRLKYRVDRWNRHEVVLLDELLGVHKSQSRIIVTLQRRSVGVRLARALASVVVAVVLTVQRRVA